jgi:hypothetical protein
LEPNNQRRRKEQLFVGRHFTKGNNLCPLKSKREKKKKEAKENLKGEGQIFAQRS